MPLQECEGQDAGPGNLTYEVQVENVGLADERDEGVSAGQHNANAGGESPESECCESEWYTV